MNKGSRTKEMILNTAFRLFARKGYATVTMKDICETTGLSRGGLYRHFSSTKEIFIEILNRDLEVNSAAVETALQSNVSAMRIFQHYLNQEKKAVFSRDKGFYFAVHEFAFLEPDQRKYFNQRVEKSGEILSKIFRHGQDRGEFRKFDIAVVSMHILSFWDSLKTSSSILTISEEEIEKQMKFIKEIIQ